MPTELPNLEVFFKKIPRVQIEQNVKILNRDQTTNQNRSRVQNQQSLFTETHRNLEGALKQPRKTERLHTELNDGRSEVSDL